MNLEDILKEPWVVNSRLITCDIDEFSISESGCLLLSDDCGTTVYVPREDKYMIRWFYGTCKYIDFEY